MAGWVPLRNHTMFSLLHGVSKPKQIAQRCKELGYTACALTDSRNIGCAVQFVSAMKEKGVKPLLGCEFDVSDSNGDDNNSKVHSVTVIAKNINGWHGLVSACSHSHHKDNCKPFPHITLEKLATYGDNNFIVISGYPGSRIADSMFHEPSKAYYHTDYSLMREKSIYDDWENRIKNETKRYLDIFGRENLFLSTEFVDPKNNPAALAVGRTIRWTSQKEKIQRVATPNSFYPHNTEQDASDQRVLLASLKKTTLKEMKRKALGGIDWPEYRPNFMGQSYHIPSMEELEIWHDEEEISNSLHIADMCEDYDIRHAPILPKFPTPDGQSADAYLTQLCQAGWSEKVYNRVDEHKWPEYQERVRKELKVIKEAGLASYFLIVQDYCNWARSVGMIVGPGRGSGAGCLVSYLIRITAVDPIKHGLIFERFYNAGRNAPGHISLPDIDCDFPVNRRKEIVAYLKGKYGSAMVANIATYNSLKGRGALTEVLRAHSEPFDEVKRITANIPEESRITEELQAMKDRGDEPSIIRYALESDPNSFKDWCVLKDDGTCEGTLGRYFEQAIRLEGTKRNISTHAAGVVLASTPLADMCPLVYDDTIDGYIAGMEYPDLESMGQVKLDILGVASLDKIAGIRNLLRYGYVEANNDAA